MFEFGWHENKNEINIQKHKISFQQASRIFYEDRVIARSNKNNEEGWATTGLLNGKFWTVIYTQDGNFIRIISARRARKKEEKHYHEKIFRQRHTRLLSFWSG